MIETLSILNILRELKKNYTKYFESLRVIRPDIFLNHLIINNYILDKISTILIRKKMTDIQVGRDSASGQFIIIDRNKKLRIMVSYEAIQDYGNFSNISNENAKSFYLSNKSIALKNKSNKLNENGFYDSSILTTDFN